MHYPLQEQIGDPDLFVGREYELTTLEQWLAGIPRRASKSRVILARRKSGKTALVQRIFNQVWSANGPVIPFYFDMAENKIWYPNLAIKYYCAFASQYISFLERDERLVREPLSLQDIQRYGASHAIPSFERDVDSLFQDQARGFYTSMWDTACGAPHRFAGVYDKRFVVIIDEFQNMAQYVYRDEKCQEALDETLPGSYHSLSESKTAPMLVTGSYVGWLIEICGKYLEAGRLSEWHIPPYLTPEAGLQAVYKYAEVYQAPVANETAMLINQLCMSDPFFISCVMQSTYPQRDLRTAEGVVNAVNYEIADRRSEMSKTWAEYIELTLQRINDRHAKALLLHLSKYNERYWNTIELKEALSLDLSLDEIKHKLILMVKSDLIEWGPADIEFRGLQDGTLNLILRRRFEMEIAGFTPDLKADFRRQVAALQADKRRLQGALNHLASQLAERLLATELRSRKRLSLADLFEGVGDTEVLDIVDVRERFVFQRADGKPCEIDVRAESNDGRLVLIEVKKTQDKVGAQAVQDFWDKVTAYVELASPDRPARCLPAFLSLGGFSSAAWALCRQYGIATATQIAYQFE